MKPGLWLIALSGLILAGWGGLQSGDSELELAKAHVTSSYVFGQGLEDAVVVAEDGATLRRNPNSISVQLKMPTPEPGSYDYPDPEDHPTAALQGHPEGFTLWVFVYDGELGGFEVEDPETGEIEVMPWSTVFFGAGHMVGGPNLTLRGQINRNTESIQPGAPMLQDLQDVQRGHLVVAPHGGLDPDIMPEQIKTPAGGPGYWWHAAVFGDPIFE